MSTSRSPSQWSKQRSTKEGSVSQFATQSCGYLPCISLKVDEINTYLLQYKRCSVSRRKHSSREQGESRRRMHTLSSRRPCSVTRLNRTIFVAPVCKSLNLVKSGLRFFLKRREGYFTSKEYQKTATCSNARQSCDCPSSFAIFAYKPQTLRIRLHANDPQGPTLDQLDSNDSAKPKA